MRTYYGRNFFLLLKAAIFFKLFFHAVIFLRLRCPGFVHGKRDKIIRLVLKNASVGEIQSIICYDQQKEFMEYLRTGGFVKVREMIDMYLGEPDAEPPMQYRSIYGGDMG